MSRQIINLYDWRFHLGRADDGWYRGGDETGWEHVRVPHDWSIKRGFSPENPSGTGYVIGGEGWYRTRFFLEPKAGQHVRITFEGVYKNSKVWCNSNYLGKRPYGYSTFTYDITEFLSPDGENEISVHVDCTKTADSRWFTGAGIVRPVYVTVTGEPYIDDFGICITSSDITSTSAKVNVAAAVVGEGDVLHKIYAADGSEVAEWSGAEGTMEVPAPALWSDVTPSLYTLRTDVYGKDGMLTDSVDTRFGIRDLRFDPDHGFFLNGASTKLRGVCLHHDAGTLGAAVPKEVWRRRLAKLKECGCNAVRTSHNPPDPDLLDLCDEMGFITMDEAFDEWEAPKNKWWQGHNVRPPKLNGYYEDFIEWGKKDLQTMILRDRNHPSIIMWSVGNEVDYPNDPYVNPDFGMMTGNNDAGKSEAERRYDPNRPHAKRLAEIAKRLSGWVKEIDTTRPVTAALAFPEMSVRIGYMQALDVAGYNYKEMFYEDHHREFPNAFIYGSENGHGPREWEYVRDNEYICGQFLWTGVDYLGEAQGWPIRCFGQGLLDLAGFETDRYLQRSVMWRPELAGHLHTTREARRSHHGEMHPPVAFLFTNGVEAELFADGVSFGKKTPEHYVCTWDISECKLDSVYTVTVTSADGTAIEVRESENGSASKLDTRVWEGDFSDGVWETNDEVAQIELSLLDENGRLAMHGGDAHPDIRVNVTGGELIGIENGDIADLTSYGEAHRKIYRGRMVVYVRGERGDEAEVTLHCRQNRELDRVVRVRFK